MAEKRLSVPYPNSRVVTQNVNDRPEKNRATDDLDGLPAKDAPSRTPWQVVSSSPVSTPADCKGVTTRPERPYTECTTFLPAGFTFWTWFTGGDSRRLQIPLDVFGFRTGYRVGNAGSPRTHQPPAGNILCGFRTAYRAGREGDGWVKARQRSEASSPEHRERSDRPRSVVCLSREVSGTPKAHQPGSFAPVRPLFTVTCILRRIPGSDSLLTASSASLRAKSGWCA